MRWLRLLFGLLVTLFSAGLLFGWWIGAPGHEGPPSAYFDGTHFQNAEDTPLPSFGRALRTFPFAERGPWEPWRTFPEQPPPPERVSEGLRATFINHATVLLQFDGLNVLTDPIYSERCSYLQWAGPERHHAPGVAFDDLPPIDVVLISHSHYDHLDVDTLTRLAERDDPLVLAGLGNDGLLDPLGVQNRTLGWTDTVEHAGLTVHGRPSRHFAGRGLFDRMRTLWLSYVLETSVGPVYFAGDTGYGRHFADAAAEFGPPALALLPIGAYEPRDFMGPIHMNPADAVQAHRDLGARQSLGIHHGTFQLTYESQDDPVEALASARGDDDTFVALLPGEALSIGTP